MWHRCDGGTRRRTTLYVSLDVWEEVEDMTEVLRKMQEEGSQTEEIDQERGFLEGVEHWL